MTIADPIASAQKWGLPLRKAAAGTGRDRREAERALAYWRSKVDAFGQNATIEALDLAAVNSPDWSNRFVIAVDNEEVGRSELLLYGSNLAQMFRLPSKARPDFTPPRDLTLVRDLPKRLAEVFLNGCAETPVRKSAVRLEGEVAHSDDRVEQYRAVFIPVPVRPNSLTHLAFGAFNSRVIEPALAA